MKKLTKKILLKYLKTETQLKKMAAADAAGIA